MKKLIISLAALCLVACVELTAEYVRPDSVSEQVWNELTPYFLPEEMPIKHKLDKVFASRPTRSFAGLKIAGFKIPRIRRAAKVVVASHPKIKGFLIKLYTDNVSFTDEWINWKRRIIGAQFIEKTVAELGYEHIFKVPKKWIYPLPPEPAGMTPGPHRKNFVLIVENMKILDPRKNEFWWRSIAMTPDKVEAIYTVFQKAGLADSVYPDNVPFCKDRKLAFVDTEHYRQWPVPFIKLLPFFNAEMQEYWLMLMQTRL